jgi:radical SAM protein with 4Fe4S-binding SPASM domain
MQIALNNSTVYVYTADMNKTSSSPTFCSAPWTTLNIDQRGHVLPCLNSMGWSNGQEHSMGNIKQTDIQSILSGTVLTNIKHTIAQGQWHDFCSTCRNNEQTSGSSARTSGLAVTTDTVKDLIDSDINGFCLTDLTVNWTNLCNLTCTYCNPSTSTAWQQVLHMPIQQVRNQSQDLIELARLNRGTLKGLTLGGGEPLLQRGLLEFLKQLDPEQVRVLITTNLAVDLTKNTVYQELRTWPRVTWMVSFDNADPDKFEYVRRGAEWPEFVANIDSMLTEDQHVVAHPAYSVYSAFDLDSYYEFCTGRNLDIFWCDLSDPGALDIRRRPTAFRVQAQEQIQHILSVYSATERNNDLSLNILQRYHDQLNEDWAQTRPIIGNTDPVKWHLKQEQIMPPDRGTFTDLWPQFK